MLTQLIHQYNNPENFDKLASTEYKVDYAQREVQNQIIEAMKNTQDLEETNIKTQKLLLEAEGYDKNANELRSTMSWRNTKLKIILAIIVLALVITVIIIVFKSKKA